MSTLDPKLCLICDDLAVVGVISKHLQHAPLCGVHWVDYSSSEASLTADEVLKFFDDGFPGDVPNSFAPTDLIWDGHKRTDETPGMYRTDDRESG